ncbi:MAG: GatB/YqeY domain-containing protein [Candidatus Taylorbacteria bacterium]
MTIHETIKNQIKEALRAKDAIRLETLRGLNALALNELLSGSLQVDFLPDEKMLLLIKRSVKQRKDSIEQFTKGGRIDLVSKEQTELAILESFMPAMMTYEQIKIVVHQRIDALKSQGTFDPKAGGKITGMIMKELSGKADGNDVKRAVEELIKDTK